MNERIHIWLEVVVAFVTSLATIALINSIWLQTHASDSINRIMFILTFPAIAFSLLLAGGVHDASVSSYVFALFIEFLLIWWLIIHIVRKIIAGLNHLLHRGH
ncbi:MAG: hypothetical protein AB1798_22900 [Spirochaetota bacterium]